MMAKELHLREEPRKILTMDPIKFALWLFIVSITMIFASLTSAYIVKKADGQWLLFDIPQIFWISTGLLLASSVTMQLAVEAAKKNNITSTRFLLGITTALGVMFLLSQFFGWQELVSQGVYFVGNPAGSFMYVFTGMHGVHLISGIIFLIIVLISAFRYKVHSRSLRRIKLCATYWHFLDGLWIYLFVFLLINN
jgi:cytochrome c oxidase subunit 3